ncbi:alpha-L-fucosidase [Luteolibacter sp. Populi]|uniref:alpha-L-fucosidase n=1 Tax=Luteolibacter sp. Populi TaxID=3230487 RepID=UPI0034662CAF
MTNFFTRWTGLAAALLSLSGTSGAGGQEGPAKQERERTLEQWQDRRFGMFVHWGVYAVPAGFHEGKPVRHLGEWIMRHGKISKEEYAGYAARLAPDGYDPGAWVRLAEEAGMKYMVVTAKHHDGFALFDSAASGWDAVDATPAKKDLLMPLVEECRKKGMPLGYHYSQAEDWWHPGGGISGTSWDPGQAGSFDSYLAAVAVPQIKELLARYGPVSSFFFDTPVNMNASRAVQIEALLPATTLSNDRLFPGSTGTFRTYENQLPQRFIPAGPWELCTSCNDTWGYKNNDQHWKGTGELLRTLVETASRGGNFLLNVGPDASGNIPQPAAESLRGIGRWLARNGESIYGTRHSPYNPIPWNGGCTSRSLPSGETVLYAHLFERPGDQLLLPGLANRLISAKLLPDGADLEFSRQGNSWRIKLPGFDGGKIPTLKITLDGKPVINPPSITPGADGKMVLGVHAALLRGNQLRLERQPNSPEPNIGYWTDQADTVAWSVDLPAAAAFASEWTVACGEDSAGAVVAVMAAGKELGRFEVPSTGGWNVFRKMPGPLLSLPAGAVEIQLVPLSKPGLGVMNLRALSLLKTR